MSRRAVVSKSILLPALVLALLHVTESFVSTTRKRIKNNNNDKNGSSRKTPLARRSTAYRIPCDVDMPHITTTTTTTTTSTTSTTTSLSAITLSRRDDVRTAVGGGDDDRRHDDRRRRRHPPNNPAINQHRHSASDWIHNVLSMPKSSVLREIRNPVIVIAVWSTLVSVVQRTFRRSTSELLQKFSKDMCIGFQCHTLVTSILGLLLVFRTNSAYQRFYEGRRIWERILSTSRNISRMVSLYGREVGIDRRRRIVNLVASFPYLLRHHIRSDCLCGDPSLALDERNGLLLRERAHDRVETRHEGDKTSVVKNVPAVASDCWVDKRTLPWSLLGGNHRALAGLANAHNRPLWVCDRMAMEMMKIPYGPNFSSRERLSLLGQVEKLTNAVGECERIHQTAVPLNYARHSLRSLTLWLVTLPFAMVKDMGLLTGPCLGAVAWLLFGVYEIGYSIEDPFQGSLRLSILCDAIRRDVLGEFESRESAFDDDDIDIDIEHGHDDDDDHEFGYGGGKGDLHGILPPASQQSWVSGPSQASSSPSSSMSQQQQEALSQLIMEHNRAELLACNDTMKVMR